MSKKLIKFEKVSIHRSGKKILHDLSFEISAGDIISVIGLNGAGKTTLLKTILGLYKPSSGKVTRYVKNIGYVPQSLAFDPNLPLTVNELLKTYAPSTPFTNSTSTKKNIVKALKYIEADQLLHKNVGSLSGGELQRVLIANAILQKSKIILLDEPTSGIDLSGQHAFYDLIEKINKEQGITIVMVSHDIHTVFAKSTHVFCLNGHLCCQGSPATVSKHPEFNKLFCNHLAPYSHNHDHKH